MTTLIRIRPVASRTVDAKLRIIEDVLDLQLQPTDAPDIRTMSEMNDLDLEEIDE